MYELAIMADTVTVVCLMHPRSEALASAVAPFLAQTDPLPFAGYGKQRRASYDPRGTHGVRRSGSGGVPSQIGSRLARP
jgi:hypothetical protein